MPLPGLRPFGCTPPLACLVARVTGHRRPQAKAAASRVSPNAACTRHECERMAASGGAKKAFVLSIRQSHQLWHPVEAAHTAHSTRARKERVGAKFVQEKVVIKR